MTGIKRKYDNCHIGRVMRSVAATIEIPDGYLKKSNDSTIMTSSAKAKCQLNTNRANQGKCYEKAV